jgi:hypothetical protein
MSKPHTLFYIVTLQEMYGPARFEEQLKIDGYTDQEIGAIKQELGKEIRKIDFKKTY